MSSSFLFSLPAAIHIGQSVLLVAGSSGQFDWEFRPTRLARDLIQVSRLPRRHWSCEVRLFTSNLTVTAKASGGIWNLAEFHPAVPAIGVLARHASLLSVCGSASLTPLITRSANDVASQDERLYPSRACNAFAYAYFHFGPAAPFHNALHAGTAPEGR